MDALLRSCNRNFCMKAGAHHLSKEAIEHSTPTGDGAIGLLGYGGSIKRMCCTLNRCAIFTLSVVIPCSL